MIVVRPFSGLCNRLRVMSSFRVLARLANREFAVCWAPGPGFSDESLDELFDHDVRLITEHEYELLSARAFRLDDVVTVEGIPPDRTWTWSPGATFEQIFDDDVSVVAYAGMQRCDELLPPDRRKAVLGDGFSAQYVDDVRTWRPAKRLRKAVDRVTAGFAPNTIGVHIRRGDAWQDPNPNSPWRRSTDEAFMSAIDAELAADPSVTFFLATDSPDTEARFKERYGAALLTNAKKRFVPSVWRAPKDNQRDAVVDLFALARTSRVFGSYYSSFSKMAAVLGSIPYSDAIPGRSAAVHDRVRRSRQPLPTCDTVGSFAVNGVGLGHTSRLIAVHDEVRRISALTSQLFVEQPKQLITDYGFEQVTLPRCQGVYMELGVLVDSDECRRVRGIIELTLGGRTPVVLHDVFVHRPLYEAAVAGGWPQALILRQRRDVRDPVDWLREVAPEVSTVFAIGAAGTVQEHKDIRVYGVEDVVRRPLGDLPLWTADAAEMRVMVTAGGGGRPESEAFLNAAIAGVDLVSRRCGCMVDARIVTGPLYAGDLHVPASSPARYTLTRYVPPTYSLYWGSSVVVAQAGYNTFQEAGGSGVPHVLVPGGDFGVDDQEERATARAHQPDVEVAPCDAEAIAKAIEHVLAAPRRDRTEVVTPNGARQIAEAVAAMAGVSA